MALLCAKEEFHGQGPQKIDGEALVRVSKFDGEALVSVSRLDSLLQTTLRPRASCVLEAVSFLRFAAFC